MERTVKEVFIRNIILVIGLFIAHFGVTLFLISNIGSDPFNVFTQGIFDSLKKLTGWGWLTHGYTHMAICIIITILLFFTDRKYVRIGTLICMFFGGRIIDLFSFILSPVFGSGMQLWTSIILNCTGCVILACGMSIVIKSDAGTGPNDLVAIVLSDKTGLKFSIMRIIVDVCFAGIGFLLGGTVGLGTVICAFVVGPVAGFFLPKNEKLINRILEKALPAYHH